jgi:hypothetical protein
LAESIDSREFKVSTQRCSVSSFPEACCRCVNSLTDPTFICFFETGNISTTIQSFRIPLQSDFARSWRIATGIAALMPVIRSHARGMNKTAAGRVHIGKIT